MAGCHSHLCLPFYPLYPPLYPLYNALPSTQAEGHNGTWNILVIYHLLTDSRAETPGTVQGVVFKTFGPRPMMVSFPSMIPQAESFKKPRYVKTEQRFSKKVRSNHIHDCTVVVGRETFLVSAYWDAEVGPNRAVESACPGLDWRGEVAVVQMGRFVTFYKQIKSPSSVNKAVSKWVVRFMLLQAQLTAFSSGTYPNTSIVSQLGIHSP